MLRRRGAGGRGGGGGDGRAFGQVFVAFQDWRRRGGWGFRGMVGWSNKVAEIRREQCEVCASTCAGNLGLVF